MHSAPTTGTWSPGTSSTRSFLPPDMRPTCRGNLVGACVAGIWGSLVTDSYTPGVLPAWALHSKSSNPWTMAVVSGLIWVPQFSAGSSEASSGGLRLSVSELEWSMLWGHNWPQSLNPLRHLFHFVPQVPTVTATSVNQHICHIKVLDPFS